MADAYLISKCIYCQEDISGLCVQCCVCEDFVFCLQCFAAGAELGTHKRNHPYKFSDDEWPNIIVVKGEGDWTASEELSLIKSIEVLGFGNWNGVSAILENRTPDEVKEHYMSRYLDGVIGKATWAGIQRPDLRGDNNITEPSDDLSRLPPLDCTLMEVYLLGYMPKRDDFDRESSTDIEAEQLISSLIGITTNNEELDASLKLAQVDMYMRRLRERVRRKKIVRDYQLIAKFFQHHRKDGRFKSHLTKEQRVFRERMRVFSQFSSAAEQEALISGLEREQELRLRLNELARYRQAGLTHVDECAHYEQHLTYLRRSQATNTPSNTTTPTNNQWKHAKSGSSGLEPSSQEVDPFLKSVSGKQSSSFIDQRYTYHTDATCTNDLQENQSRATSPEMEWSPTQTGSISHHQQAPNPTKMNLRPVPPHELLPENEYKLCKSLNMHPLQYITLKTILLKKNISNSDLDSSSEDEGLDSSPPRPYMWDANCINKVSDYMYSNGWIY